MENIENNRSKLIILFVILYIAIVALILWFIWFKPTKEEETSNLSKYTEYTEEQAKTKLFDTYSQEIIPLFVLGYSDLLYDITDETFLKEKSLNKENFGEYLKSNGYFVSNIVNAQYTSVKEDTTIIYTCKYVFNGANKIINIIEKKPNDYKISFENEIYTSGENRFKITRESNGMIFDVEEVSREINRITYKFSITNKGTDRIKFKFDNATDVKIGVVGQGVYPISSFVSITGQNELNGGSTINRTYNFDIPVAFQNLNKQLIFYSVSINGETKDIYINL